MTLCSDRGAKREVSGGDGGGGGWEGASGTGPPGREGRGVTQTAVEAPAGHRELQLPRPGMRHWAPVPSRPLVNTLTPPRWPPIEGPLPPDGRQHPSPSLPVDRAVFNGPVCDWHVPRTTPFWYEQIKNYP